LSRSIDAVWARAAKHLQAVAKVVSQMEDLTRSRNVPESEHDIRAAASYLDDFYSAAESVFGIIASAVDDSMPKGEAWHAALLDQIAHEVRGVRPAVISPDLYRKLGDYLSFRHVGRHAYGYELRWEKMRRLVESLPLVAAQLAEELEVFRRGIAELETDL